MKLKKERNLSDVKSVWIKEWIKDLIRERNVSVRVLNDFCDEQTPSSVFYDDMVCTGEEKGPSVKRRYIQSRVIEFEHAGILGHISFSNKEVYINFSSKKRFFGEVGIIPVASNSIRLVCFSEKGDEL